MTDLVLFRVSKGMVTVADTEKGGRGDRGREDTVRMQHMHIEATSGTHTLVERHKICFAQQPRAAVVELGVPPQVTRDQVEANHAAHLEEERVVEEGQRKGTGVRNTHPATHQISPAGRPPDIL